MPLTKVFPPMINGSPSGVLTAGMELSDVLAAIGAEETQLTINVDVVVTDDTTIPETLAVTVINGSTITISANKTLTINGPFSAPLSQVFVATTASNVEFNNKRCSIAYPEWWGANAGTTGDDLFAIQSAVDAFPSGNGKVVFTNVGYRVSNAIEITKSRMTLEGVIRVTRENLTGTSTIISTSNINPCLHVLGTTAGGNFDGTLEDTQITNMMFSRTAMGIAGSKTVIVENALFCTFLQSGAAFSQYGLYAKNVNGLRMNYYHATVGGDLAGNVYGVYIDGATQASTGILINDFIFYGSSTPSGISYAYYDYAGNYTGATTGDRRFINFECSGDTNYGIWIQDNAGFSADIYIGEFTADSIKNTFLTVYTASPKPWQQMVIEGGWVNLTNTTGAASAIWITGRAGVKISDVSAVDAGTSGLNNLFRFAGMQQSTVTGCVAIGDGTNAQTSLFMQQDTNSNQCRGNVIEGFVCGTGQVNIYNTASCIFNGINGVDTTFLFDTTSNYNRLYASLFTTITNNGTGNVIV